MEVLKKLIKYNNECRQETHISAVLVNNLAAGKFSDDPLLAKHLLCISKKAGYQDDNGNILLEQNREILTRILEDPLKVDEVVNACIKQYETPEKTAVEVTKCLKEKII